MVVFHTFLLPICAYVLFRARRHHSTKSAKGGGEFDTVCPPCLQVGTTLPPLPSRHGSAAYDVAAVPAAADLRAELTRGT